MANLKTKYMGLELDSPVVAASCGLTADVAKMEEMERAGVGAVVLKSIFEEQIDEESTRLFREGYGVGGGYAEAEDYIKAYVRSNTIQRYVELVREAKRRLRVPVIASVNCFSGGEWVSFAKELEEAGADALELNVFVLPVNAFTSSTDIEGIYFDIVRSVKRQTRVPVAVKISHYFTNLPAFVGRLRAEGASAVTLFNRFYEPDIDIERMAMGAAPVFSTGAELRTTLRWTGILCGKDRQLQLSASTGVHSGEAAIKLLLAGAGAVQVCSVLYEEGIPAIRKMNDTLREWMERKGYASVADFRGKLSYADAAHAERYERTQFMKYFSDKK